MLDDIKLVHSRTVSSSVDVKPYEIGDALFSFINAHVGEMLRKRGFITNHQLQYNQYKFERRKDSLWGIGFGDDDKWTEVATAGDKLFKLVEAAEILLGLSPEVRYPWLAGPPEIPKNNKVDL